jgi:hypothetical protein
MTRSASEFQSAASTQTLAQGLAEYHAANPHLKRGDDLSPDARDFFRSHDVVHVLYGCGTSMPDEAVVKLASVFGTTGGFSILGGYRLHDSLEIYLKLPLGSSLIAFLSAPYLIVRTLWRCSRQPAKWPWAGHAQHMHTALRELRSKFGIRVAHASRTSAA